MKIENILYNELTLKELEFYIQNHDSKEALKDLSKAFSKYSKYRNLDEWNKSVRLCEALTILGWGNSKPVEAHKSLFFNGNPYTAFYDKNEQENIQSAIWSKRKNGFTIEPDRVIRFNKGKSDQPFRIQDIEIDIRNGKFESQRNWIPKNPVKTFYFVNNAFSELEYFKSKIDSLKRYLDYQLENSKYGRTFNYFSISCNFSSEFTEYTIVPQSEKRKNVYTYGKIETPKFKFNRFTKRDGVYTLDYYIAKEVGKLSKNEQLQTLKNDFIYMIEHSIEKLKSKCPNYNFKLLQNDLQNCIEKWEETTSNTV